MNEHEKDIAERHKRWGLEGQFKVFKMECPRCQSHREMRAARLIELGR
jgi:hypothetical protein